MSSTQQHRTADRGADTALSPPPLLAGGPDEHPLPPPWTSRSVRIAEAVRCGEHAEAALLADRLHQDVVGALGAGHPDALTAQEVRAYLAHRGGDHQLAARLYREVAAEWASTGSPACWSATINAQAAEAAAAGPPRPSHLALAARRLTAAGHTAAVVVGRTAARPAGRRTVVIALVAAVVLAAATAPTERPGPLPDAGNAVELAASPALLALERVPAAEPVPPAHASVPTPVPVPAPVAEEPLPEEEREPAPAARPAAPRRPSPGRSTSPSTQPVRPPSPPAQPGHPAAPRPAAPPTEEPADLCSRGGAVGLPQHIVDLCRQHVR